MIAPAEMPLNHRGAVYHLDLLPEELADVIITVGDPGRVEQISQHFDHVEIKRAHREFVTHTGTIGQQRLSVLSTGIGVPNIDIVINEMDALANVDLKTRLPRNQHKELTIIRLGTTGGLQASCKPGEILITQYAIGFDTLLNYYQRSHSSTLQEMEEHLKTHLRDECGSFYVTEAHHALVNHFKNLGSIGITATCGGFYGPQGRKIRAELRYPDLLERLRTFHFHGLEVLNFEMESAGILGMGQLLGHRCLSLSVILANRITGEFAENVSEQVNHIIEQGLEYLSNLFVEDKKPAY